MNLRFAVPKTVISVTEVNLARAPRALEGEVRGGSSLEGRVRGGCGVKVAIRGWIEARSASTRSYPIFLACKCVTNSHREFENYLMTL